ncbi:hypothetical protein MF672_051075 (plasmid) [Actinomadura sp. ATCC 31491]|uniref:Uncharacterized protein n=1 Tax=Actinomadura luzonensis TaxID=2805427 RepID=A0ABT0GBW5_9ACTN|nr:hypothetical protein [Actinomadura luzonensis]MCK2222097.1 hypothetical protein [Actinomadura luzonensis]
MPQDDRPSPFTRDEQPFESWEELRDNADQFDDDLNVVIWWDWYPPSDGSPTDTLILYVAMGGQERVYPWSAPVTRGQEPEIRAWLQHRLRRLLGYWQIIPIPQEGPA